MKRIAKQLAKMAFLAVVAAMCATVAGAQTTDSGSITLQGSVSGYVEVRAGGAASISGNSGGGISNNKVKGDRLDNPTVLTVDFGEVGPTNTNNFVSAVVPLRLRSNVSYTLKMSAGAMTYGSGTPDAQSVTLADIGFGVTSATRDSGGGVATGTDTVAAAASGNPTGGSRGSVNGTSGRYEYVAGASLNDYTTATTILSGPRIMNASVPTGNTNGLVVNTMFAVKPQFFTPGSFSTSVTFTISNP
ncbi:MAG TPA: hypothetical protein VNN73_00880 [Blastocatellia bacterium]|nr:hypothetical protein [Blastocatellia bacterium]